jgi:hypothetical protein
MPYYTDNTSLIGPAKLISQTAIYDVDYARINPISTGSPAMAINFAIGTNVAFPGTQAAYGSSTGTIIPAGINYVFANGYHYFTLQPGTYAVNIKGAEGSGQNHGRGAVIDATLVVTEAARFVALVGNYGSGNYGGGGMTAIALRNAANDGYATAIPVLVAGGGGGGYSFSTPQADAGHIQDSPTIRRGAATDGGGLGNYDGGAAFLNVYAPLHYSNVTGTQGGVGAQHFVWGGLGGRTDMCGQGWGGFGGGAGTCPGGGGGYYGGKAGGDSPSGSPGGGGTSYRLATPGIAYISNWLNAGYNGASTILIPYAGGFFSITPV